MIMAKKNEAKKEMAFLFYMNGMMQKEILERCEIGSPITLQRWIEKGGWKEKRAAKTITRTELVNGVLERIANMLDGDNENFNADQLVKLASTIERLDKTNSPVLAMEVFMNFTRWLQQQAVTDRELTLEVIKTFNKYQDAYISAKMSGA